MIRTIFKHKYPQQKETESLLGANIRLHKTTKKLTAQIETFTGNGEPSNAIGKENDIYIDKESQLIYSKENGSWS